MGRLVELWKLDETDEVVTYLYGPDKENTGKLTINKKTGVIDGESVKGMEARESWFFYGMLAKSRAEQMFRDKDYPEIASRAT